MLPWPPERTLVQESRPYDERYDVATDAVAVYTADATLETRVAAWRARGYRIHFMTGLAWGEYQDYVLGRWDGQSHWDEAQYRADGKARQHGQDMPYMVPSDSFAAYLETLLRRAIDVGAEIIFLEEPEFWSNTGYGPAFQRAWLARYGEPWRDPATDPHAYVLAAALKQALYRDLIARLCRFVSTYSAGRAAAPVRCCVATHSPLNYTAWSIVSPELSMRAIPNLDGFIVQTWSFTARTQTYYEGRKRDRIFAIALLEYGSGIELARGTERQLWLLTDPVEDRPNQTWDQYREGYQATVAAALCWPEVGAFEVMPWPGRVFSGRYPRRPDGTDGDPIPPAYAAQILAIANALRAIPREPVVWDCGTQGLGVLIADTMLLRRGGPADDDVELTSFYGLALPLVLAGMPARPVALETLVEGVAPPPVLLLSYDGMTPAGPQVHEALAAWVRAGGALICFGSGAGPYETLPDWWNAEVGGTGPWPDLLGRLGLPADPAPGQHRVEQGLVVIEPAGPKDLARRADGAALVRARVREALAGLGAAAPAYREQAYLALRRGPYLVAAAFEEAHGAVMDRPALRLRGRFVDLFDGTLPVRAQVDIMPGDCALLIDLDLLQDGPARVVAAAARIDDEQVDGKTLRFRARGPLDTTAVVRVRLPAPPAGVRAAGVPIDVAWDPASHTALLRHANRPAGVAFEVRW